MVKKKKEENGRESRYKKRRLVSESSYIHWLLLCVLNIHTSSLTVRGALWMISLWKMWRPKKGILLCASRGQFSEILRGFLK